MILGRSISNGAVVRTNRRDVPFVQRSVVRHATGFGKTSSKKVDTGAKLGSKIKKELGLEDAADAARVADAPGGPISKQDQPSASAAAMGIDVKKGWKDCGVLTELFANRTNNKVVELAAGKAIMLYFYKGKVYCTDANSTAYQYPLIDAKVSDNAAGKPVLEVPLDGTIYDLATGKVEVWCPKDGSIIRSVLGALKKVETPIDLKTWRNVVTDGRVYVKVYEGEY